MPTYTPTSIQALTQKPVPVINSAPVTENAPGAMQYNSGAYASMVPPTVPSVARTATTTPSPTPAGETVAQTYARGQAVLAGLPPVSANNAPTDPTVGATFSGVDYGPDYPTYQELYPELETEEQLYKKKLKMYQSQINATNQVYDNMLNQEVLAGQGRLGSNRAMSARGGLLGSDFGYANEQGVIAANTSAERAIQAERQAKVGAIMGEVRSSVVAELKEKREARQQGAKNYIEYLAGADDRRNKNLSKAAKALLLAGLDPVTMDPAELEAIAKEGGLSAKDIALSYNELKTEQDSATAEADLNTRKTEAEIAKLEDKSFVLSEGQTRYDAQGNVIASKGKTYAPGTGGGLKVGGRTLDTQEIADVHQVLNESRGKDKYANTETYMNEFNGFVALGGDPKDFLKEYDPNVYINPKDETRSFLQTYMKTTPAEAVQKELTALEQLQQLQEMQANQ